MTSLIPQTTEQRQAGDRAVGCLYGLAIGEAVGAVAQATAPVQGSRETSPLGRHLVSALALADSLLDRRALEPIDVMDGFLKAYLNSHTDPAIHPALGPTTTASILAYYRTGDAHSGSSAPGTDTSGCLARLAPVVIFAGGNANAARHEACVQAFLTHAHPHCLLAVDLFAQKLWRALRGFPPVAIFETGEWPYAAGLADVANGSFKVEAPGNLRHSWTDVASTLEAALWAVHGADSFSDAMTRLVGRAKTSRDLPAIGAVAGQLAGAIWGAQGIDAHFMAAAIGAVGHRARELLLASDQRAGFVRFLS